MDYLKKIDINIFKKFSIPKESKIYYSNIGYIIVSKKNDFVYKVFNKKETYFKELENYFLFKKYNILIPEFKGYGNFNGNYILILENIRKDFSRKNNILDLDIKQVAKLVNKIHSIKRNKKSFIIGDIHSSNFFELKYKENKKLGIFDLSSSYYGDIEADLSNIYIDYGLSKNNFNLFLKYYGLSINYSKLYKYTIKELFERIKNGMNLPMEKRKLYYKYILIIKNKGLVK